MLFLQQNDLSLARDEGSIKDSPLFTVNNQRPRATAAALGGSKTVPKPCVLLHFSNQGLPNPVFYDTLFDGVVGNPLFSESKLIEQIVWRSLSLQMGPWRFGAKLANWAIRSSLSFA